jgi:hypothetical protein
MKCQTCKKTYVGQTGRKLEVRYKEHIRYIKNNNEQSAYATHILQNRHEFGPINETMKLLHKATKGKRMNTLENYYIQKNYAHIIIIREQTINRLNSPFQMAINMESRDKTDRPDSRRPQLDDTVSQ